MPSLSGGRGDTSRRGGGVSAVMPRFWTQPTTNFWAWPEFADYAAFVATFTCATSVLTRVFAWSYIYAEALGSVSVMVEAIILVPQAVRNWERQSTEGLSGEMIFMWCAGDFLKLTYFTVSQVPVQFVVCAIVQCSIDIVISLQMFTYRKGEPTVAPVPASRRLSPEYRR